MRQGLQDKPHHEAQFFRTQLRLHAFENFREKPMAEGKRLLGFPVGRLLFGLPPELLFFFLLSFAEMDGAGAGRAYLDETAFVQAVGVDSRDQMTAQTLCGACRIPTFGLSRNDFDVVPPRQNRRLPGHRVLVGNEHEVRQLGNALRDVCVQFSIEAGSIGASVFQMLVVKQ